MNKEKIWMLIALVSISILAGTLVSPFIVRGQTPSQDTTAQTEQQQVYNDTVKISLLNYQPNDLEYSTFLRYAGGVIVSNVPIPFIFEPSGTRFNVTDLWVFVTFSGEEPGAWTKLTQVKVNNASWVSVGAEVKYPSATSIHIHDSSIFQTIIFGINTITLQHDAGGDRLYVYQLDVLIMYEYFR